MVIGIGTRYSDFTTGSRTVFQNPDVVFVNLNVASFDAYKHGSQLPVIADAREGLGALLDELDRWQVSAEYAERIRREQAEWDATVEQAFAPSGLALPGQPEIIGAVHDSSDPRDVIVQAAGSLPGDLHKLWRVRDVLGYHVEYAFSCMGYEIAGGLGVRRAIDAAAAGEEAADRDVIVMVGDGSYLMLHSELVTAVAEGRKLIVIIVQNHGYASIGHLSETVGSERFGTWYREYDPAAKNFQSGAVLPLDLAANARSYGVDVIDIEPSPAAIDELRAAVRTAKASTRTTVIHLNSDPLIYGPDGEGWWDVPVAAVSTAPETQRARAEYVEQLTRQRPLLG